MNLPLGMMCTLRHCSPEYPTFSIARALNYVSYEWQTIESNLHAFPSLVLHYSFPVLPVFWSLPFSRPEIAWRELAMLQVRKNYSGPVDYGEPPSVPHSCCALVRNLGFSPITHGPSCSFYYITLPFRGLWLVEVKKLWYTSERAIRWAFTSEATLLWITFFYVTSFQNYIKKEVLILYLK